MSDTDADDVLEALRQQLVDTENPVASSTQIAANLPIKRRQVLYHLRILEARGDVGSVSIGAGTAWYAVDVVHVGTDRVPPAAPTPAPSTAPTPEPTSEPAPEPTAESASTTPDADTHSNGRDRDRARDEIVDELDIPGREAVQEPRREAVRAVLEHLDDAGEPVPAGTLRDLYDDHPAGYKHETSWWSNFMLLALKDLADQDVVELTNPSRGRWRTL